MHFIEISNIFKSEKKRYKVTKGNKWISPDDPDYNKETD